MWATVAYNTVGNVQEQKQLHQANKLRNQLNLSEYPTNKIKLQMLVFGKLITELTTECSLV